MDKILKTAIGYLRRGYSVIPCTDHKLPSVPNWGRYQTTPMTEQDAYHHFQDARSIALLCGGPQRVVALDADMKYDLSGDLWKRFKKKVPREILSKMMCQKTQNGGYHLVFIAPATRLVGNEKLASRYTMEAFEDPEYRDKALKIAASDSSRVLFETRSGTPERAGGYILISPSKGYSIEYGKIQEITEDEYDALMETARSFNEVKTLETFKEADYHVKWKKSPFDHYCEEGDVVQLLCDYGWTIIEEAKANNIRFLRPGKTYSSNSAMFDTRRRIFNCFSTSTAFDTGKGYNAAGVFITLVCEGDTSAAYKRLVQMGYGLK
jgi:hypothetical protein